MLSTFAIIVTSSSSSSSSSCMAGKFCVIILFRLDSLVCRKGETTELVNGVVFVNVLFILFSSLSSVVYRRYSWRGWQKELEPPRQFSIVVALLCPGASFVQSPEIWLQPPWVCQYSFVIRRSNVALSAVRRFLFPLPPLPPSSSLHPILLLSPLPPRHTLWVLFA